MLKSQCAWATELNKIKTASNEHLVIVDDTDKLPFDEVSKLTERISRLQSKIKEILAEECLKMQSYGAGGVIIMDSAGAYIPADVTERISAIVGGFTKLPKEKDLDAMLDMLEGMRPDAEATIELLAPQRALA